MVESQAQSFKTRMINKISLAPMVRILSRAYGADYVFSEEIIDRKFQHCVRYENQDLNCIDYISTRDYAVILRCIKEEKEQFILQIGTNNAQTAIQAVEKVQEDICGVDVNMGCPKKFSVGGGMGSALMRDIDNAKFIMKSLVDKFGQLMSVSCKIRVLGTFEETMNYILAMQDAGVHWISIHPRTAAQESKVPARWFIVKKIIDSGLVKIPVLGSGDLFSPIDINQFIQFTGASGVIVARGAIHNCALFTQKQEMLNPNTYEENFELWIDNTQEQQQKEESVLQKQIFEQENQKTDNAKQKNKKSGGGDDENVEFSLNLVKVFETRYQKYPMLVPILDQVREYFRLCIEFGNHFQNAKYVILYMLKTHKDHFELFKQLQYGRNFQDYARILEIEYMLKDVDQIKQLHFDAQYYRKNKNIIDEIVKAKQAQTDDGLNAQVGSKRTNEEILNEQQIQQIEDGNLKRLKT
ncbi:trna-dihydrouridine synthase 2-like [Stylonychia lemnae]|uniref:Trna-dihydrouridine synthase 2-like n=1 Tax=Stylonychia lemnae TaxID=5949 RepID=A0A078B275_STYLE|nr:trna-dihydrouridine synthase 2-like [Stylonychia lemnae]|eukprot:CDW87538.1 trna-dihydrouridine synthase 2-like [Stylonychia lemnae]